MQFSVRPLPFLAVVLGGWFVWASTTDGGVSARVQDIVDAGQELVNDATTDPNLKRAANFYNARYERDGAYPILSEDAIREDPDGGFGVGVDVDWCNADAIVLHSMSGHGTISRLLLRGADLGDVHGKVLCPPDLANPLPWRLPQVASG